MRISDWSSDVCSSDLHVVYPFHWQSFEDSWASDRWRDRSLTVRSVDRPGAVGVPDRTEAPLLDAVVEPAVRIGVGDVRRSSAPGWVPVVHLEAPPRGVTAGPQAAEASGAPQERLEERCVPSGPGEEALPATKVSRNRRWWRQSGAVR